MIFVWLGVRSLEWRLEERPEKIRLDAKCELNITNFTCFTSLSVFVGKVVPYCFSRRRMSFNLKSTSITLELYEHVVSFMQSLHVQELSKAVKTQNKMREASKHLVASIVTTSSFATERSFMFHSCSLPRSLMSFVSTASSYIICSIILHNQPSIRVVSHH